jgi:hypothetical protein
MPLLTEASLVVRRNLHPAIQYLLLELRKRCTPHQVYSTKQASSQRPINRIPLSAQASILQNGIAILAATLPFWWPCLSAVAGAGDSACGRAFPVLHSRRQSMAGWDAPGLQAVLN